MNQANPAAGRQRLRILLSNDDGIDSAGLQALAAQLAPRCDVLVVAPETSQGAKSHSVTLHKPVRLNAVDNFVPGSDPTKMQVYSCSGTPADCVMLGTLHLWKNDPPHLVISGINDGENIAQDISYSGTVGAALEGVCCGIPSIALSNEGYRSPGVEVGAIAAELVLSILLYGRIFAHQAEVAVAWRHNGHVDPNAVWEIPELRSDGETTTSYPPPGQWYPAGLATLPCLNINIPAMPLHEIHGIIWTRAGKREYQDVVKPCVDPRGREYYWVAGDKVLYEDTHAGTDTHGATHGYITVTPLSFDRTNFADLPLLREWVMERDR